MISALNTPRATSIRQLIALGVGAIASLSASAAELQLPQDGWVSWEVTTVADAPGWCCYDYGGGKVQPQVCDLDSRQHGYSGDRAGQPASGSARIYALMHAGQAQRLRALDSSCAVHTASPVQALGSVDVDTSVTWLADRLQPRSKLSNDVLAAIAVHAGDSAKQTLLRSAELPTDQQTREQALFWLGQVRGIESADFLQAKMSDDPNPKIREHAGFALAMSDAPNRATALIKQGREDPSGNVRGQAWFWLAQTKDAGAEAAIHAALADERDGEVREQQIFALSQLPDERAAKALIGIIGDPKQAQASRKHALFWLGQSDSDEAYRYLDELLADQ